jgi:hypothetical protein
MQIFIYKISSFDLHVCLIQYILRNYILYKYRNVYISFFLSICLTHVTGIRSRYELIMPAFDFWKYLFLCEIVCMRVCLYVYV